MHIICWDLTNGRFKPTNTVTQWRNQLLSLLYPIAKGKIKK